MKTPDFWHKTNIITQLLKPLSFLYTYIAEKNKQNNLDQQKRLPVPVIVVGNINVGGTGKTPVTIALIQALKEKDYNVGLISRGYGRESKEVVVSDGKLSAKLLGDEPYLIQQKTSVPVAVSNQRYGAGIALLKEHPEIDVIISDDGLQHYALHRDFEVAVFGQQGIGNGHVLPAGPLREGVDRLNNVDAILTIDDSFQFLIPYSEKCYKIAQQIGVPYQLNNSKQTREWNNFSHVSAVAGIAHPNNFFSALSSKSIHVKAYPFTDHHIYHLTDFAKMAAPILMTEKDAVKCTQILNHHDVWVVPLETQLPQAFIESVVDKINASKLLQTDQV